MLNSGEEDKGPSSIDRFFWAKSTRFYSGAPNSAGLAAWILSGSFGIAAIVFMILSLTVKGFPIALLSVFAPIGIVSLVTAIVLEKKNRKPIQSEVKISSSGRRLLYRIGTHIGWYDPDQWRNNHPNSWNTWWQAIVGRKTASQVLKSNSSQILEVACNEYNRLTGLLKLVKESQGRSSNMAPQIQAASDEAMISLINQIGLMEDNPETEAAIVNHCHAQIAKLKELADRFEEMLSGPTTIADRLSSTTVMDSVLDQMRLEAQAHEELRVMDRLD